MDARRQADFEAEVEEHFGRMIDAATRAGNAVPLE